MADSKALKDIYDRAAVRFLAARMSRVRPAFPADRFVREVVADLPALELKGRALRIAQGLRAHLPDDYAKALALVLRAAGAADGTGGIGGMSGFRFLPLLNFVGQYGLDDPDRSLEALGRLTLHFSAEFDVRPFLLRHPDLTLKRLHAWARDADWRVRRLASEGSRPLLPWGLRVPALIADPSKTMAILDRLHADPSEVVRRSVANHLNDVARSHPDLAVATARNWWNGTKRRVEARGTVRHALRTLVKQGHPDALELLGFAGGTAVELAAFDLGTPRVRYGGHLEFAARLRVTAKMPVRLSIDYAVCHRRADGSLRAKIFKLAVREAGPGETVEFAKRHAIRPITTRRYYPGTQAVELRVNGRALARAEFELEM